jgi:phosphoserine phosphatase
MEKVLTLIAPRGALAPEHHAKAAEALRNAGAEVGAVAPLAAHEAADIAFAGLPLDVADRAARAALAGSPVDAIAQDAAGRRKRLLIADMDSTMVTSETLDELAGEAGLKEEISAITRRAMNGELDFEGALRERVGMLKGLALEALELR